MGENVVNLTDARAAREPQELTISGEAKCLACKHEWVGVWPVGTDNLECPSCNLLRGVSKWPLVGTSGFFWRCNCGNDLFRLTPNAAMCCGCGAMPEDFRR